MSDTLLRIGRGVSNVNFSITTIVALGVIGFGIYFLVNQQSDPHKVDPQIPTNANNTTVGIGAIVFGIVLLLIGWGTRQLIRKSDTFARFAGLTTILRPFK